MAAVQEMYCHNPECKMFNREVPVRYHPEDYFGPPEWIDDPECTYCFSELSEKGFDPEMLMEEVQDLVFPDEFGDYTKGQLTLLGDISRALEGFKRAQKD